MWVVGSHGIALNAVGSAFTICKKPTAENRCRGYPLLEGKKILFPEHRVETFAKAERKTRERQEELF